MVFQGGAFYLLDGLRWNLGQAVDVRRRLSHPELSRDSPIGLTDEEDELVEEHWVWHLPLSTMNAQSLPDYMPGYFEMLAHPSYDSYWEKFDISRRHGRFETPALHLTGWYDSLLVGTLRNFQGLRANAATRLPAPDSGSSSDRGLMRGRAFRRPASAAWTSAPRPGSIRPRSWSDGFGSS